MSWQDLLSTAENITVPWVGGRAFTHGGRAFRIKGRLPPEHGWNVFEISGGTTAKWVGEGMSDPDFEEGRELIRGYMIGDRMVPDRATVVPDPEKMFEQSVFVHLAEVGLERFARGMAAKSGDNWIWVREEFPLGPESDVLMAYQDRKDSLNDIPFVTPALDLAFRWETWQRSNAEEIRRIAEEKRLEEEKRQRLLGNLMDGAARRELAKEDFQTAAAATLRVSGAQLLDFRPHRTRGEMVVQFRFRNRRFECVVETATLGITDAGICLVNHQTNERGDTYFTLESFPAVIAEAMDTGRLVVWRHVDNNYYGDEDEDW